ncbi:MAG: hypothetical protein Kow0020_07600 [Wenzhouxiangellaceae bacterium]
MRGAGAVLILGLALCNASCALSGLPDGDAQKPGNGISQTKDLANPVDHLLARFDTLWPEPTYMIATVDTPEGLWNVYVVSIPPDQVAVRQSRPDGEYEFGLIGDLIWHQALGRTKATRLDPEYAWFLRNHELFRFSEWIRTLHDFELAEDDAEQVACRTLRARDRFDLPVSLCIEPDGDVQWIERQPPAAYGTSPLRIEIRQWEVYEGRRLPRRYRQIRDGRAFDWEVQAIYPVSESTASLSPPPELLAPPE